MIIDWNLVFMIVSISVFFVWVYYMAVVKSGPGCSGNCQQGRLPCDCVLNKKDQV